MGKSRDKFHGPALITTKALHYLFWKAVFFLRAEQEKKVIDKKND